MELGGLGIESLRLRKEALLAKWLWQLFMEPFILWHKVSVSRYGSHPFEWVGVGGLNRHYKDLWEAIVCGFPSFSPYFKR